MFASWLNTLIESAVISTVLLGLALYFLKNLVTLRLKGAIQDEYDTKLASLKAQLEASNSKEIEVLKAQLKGHADVELEQLKSQLQVRAAEQNMTFTKLHERRVDVIDRTHSLLQDMHSAVGKYVSGLQLDGGKSEGDLLADVIKAYDEYYPYFLQKQLFLPRKVAKSMGGILDELRRVTNIMTVAVRRSSESPDTEKWAAVLIDLSTSIRGAIGELQEEMRIALGDEAEPAHS